MGKGRITLGICWRLSLFCTIMCLDCWIRLGPHVGWLDVYLGLFGDSLENQGA